MSSQAPPPNQPAQDSGFGDRDGTVKIRIGLDDEKPARVQYIVAGVLAVSLIVIPLALLNRSRTVGKPIAPSPSASAPDPADLLVVNGTEDAGATEVQLSAFKLTSCHDPGTKRTPPEQCDHPDGLETSIRAAVRDAQSCVPDNTGGAIAYSFDVGFSKKKGSIAVSAKDARTLKNAKVAQKCADLVREKLEQQPLDQIKHDHARYKVSATATYPGPQQ
jgi:hypothetical protein